MKRIVYIILLIFSTTCLFAQEGEKLSAYCQNFNFQEIEIGLNDFHGKSTDLIKYNWRTVLKRELINDFFEQIIVFRKEVRDEDNSAIHTIYTYKIKLIRTKEGKVAYWKVVRLETVKSNGEIVTNEIILNENSNDLLDQLKTIFQKVYSEPFNFEGLFETDIVYGYYCGYIGIEPIYRVKMIQLVESKDTVTLIKWLKSTNVEIQLYAIDGILTLKKAGLNFDKAILDLIDIIARKKGTAYTCSGCFHMQQPISKIVKRIKKSTKKAKKS